MARKNKKKTRVWYLNKPMGKGNLIVPVLKPVKTLPADLNPQQKTQAYAKNLSRLNKSIPRT